MGARDASRACAICSEDVDALRGVPRETTCAHVLCQDCAKLWFGSETTCPACNAPQKTEDARTEKTAEKASEGANASSSSRETRDAEDEREMRGAASAFLLPANPNDASASAANADADASNVARVLMERLGEEWRKLSTRCSTLERENAALSDECASLKRALSRQKALTDDAEGGGGGGELRAMPLEALDATLTEDEDEDGGGDGGGGGGDAAAACEPSELRWRRAASSSSSTIHCVSYETSDEPLHACATHPTSSRDVVVVASWDGVATIHEATTTTTTRVGRSRVLSENTTTGTPTRRTPHHLHHRDYAPIATLVGHDAGLYAVAFRASDEKLVGTASGDGGVRLFDWSDVSDSVAPCVRHIRAHDGAEVNDVAFQDGGGARWLVTASDDGTARVYDVATGARVGVAEGHAAEVYGARFGPGASGGAHADVIATASFDGTVKLWDTRAPGTNTAGNASNGSFACVSTLAGHADDVVGVDFRPGGTYVASGSDDGTARVWDLRTAACVATIDGGGEVKRVAWSPDGGAIASACGGGVARVTPSSGGTFAAAVASSASASLGGGGPGGGGHADVVFDVAWTRDGGTVITASHDATWRTWSA